MNDKYDRRAHRKGSKPNKAAGKDLPVPPDPIDGNEVTPFFCLANLHGDFGLDMLDTNQKAAFADALALRAKMTWTDIYRDGKHALGSELIPVDIIKPGVPPGFEKDAKVMVFRYHDRLPMVGVRRLRVFHLLWIERQYGELYNHG